MERAQDTFKRMMQGRVAPALRDLGFRGSGQVYALPSDSHWAQLGFQRSAFGDSRVGRFTINLSVVTKAAWAERSRQKSDGRDRPVANSKYGPPVWCERIGRLLPEGEDRWWSLPAGAPTDAVAEEVIVAVRDYALPEMRRQIEGVADARPLR
jgi:hypothetical protein